MTQDVEAYYDEFSRRFPKDIVEGNRRIDCQLTLLSSAIPRDVRAVLVIGFGSGQAAHHVATIARQATITAVDISSENLRIAAALFAHPRIQYRKLDVTTDTLEGTYDLVFLPDVYEHIPLTSRPALHETLDRLLAADGRCILTLPSPGHQALLAGGGEGLQPVDETVTLDDLVTLARDVHGTLTYFNSISVWGANDYVHAVIERLADHELPLTDRDRLPIKGWSPHHRAHRAWRFLSWRMGLDTLLRRWRRRKLERRLASSGDPGVAKRVP
jgi:trans-aconitate methyltransferase